MDDQTSSLYKYVCTRCGFVILRPTRIAENLVHCTLCRHDVTIYWKPATAEEVQREIEARR